jgi:hypothetical protein
MAVAAVDLAANEKVVHEGQLTGRDVREDGAEA